MTIFDLVTSQAIATYWTALQSNAIPFLGTALFPASKKIGLDLSWILGADSLPVALMPSAFDAKPTLRPRIGVTKVETEMPFFREAMRVGEKERQQMLMYMENATSNPYARALLDKIYADSAQLIDGANVQAERMRMSLLVDGTITITAPTASGTAASYDYDYDANGSWAANNTGELTNTDMWSDLEHSTPVQDVLEVKRKMANKYGITITRAILNSVTWAYLVGNKSIRLDMNPLGGQNIILGDADVMTYFERKTGVSFIIYDKSYKDESKVEKKFYPDGYVTFLPASTLGSTWYGTTPEEADLMSGATDASVSLVNTGVAVLTKKESLPVNIITSVSQIVLPSFERMLDIYVLHVAS